MRRHSPLLASNGSQSTSTTGSYDYNDTTYRDQQGNAEEPERHEGRAEDHGGQLDVTIEDEIGPGPGPALEDDARSPRYIETVATRSRPDGLIFNIDGLNAVSEGMSYAPRPEQLARRIGQNNPHIGAKPIIPATWTLCV